MQDGAVLVIGGSGGLGEAICRRMPLDWPAMAFTYFGNAAKADALKSDMPAECRVEAMRVDTRSETDVAAAIAHADAMPGGLRSIVYASGAPILQPYVSQIDQDQWLRVVEIELLGFTRLVRLSIPVLRKNGGGSFVSVVSFANYWFPPGDAISAVPKAGIEVLTRAVAKEEGRYGIRGNSVAPGIIDAGLGHSLQDKVHTPEVWAQQKKRVPLRRFGEGAEIAEAVAFLASDRASYITGQTIIVDGGLRL
ncbi:SDR family NAD(P)-dependent oxidoreductase [Chelatococcus asaccharovorans]|uniref:SDR family NAD(P)-dependent oxidoreductase n=1 Tax=Chelatococcus asaccharovorans TaxID=28210 RepID=UPI00224C6744|nr:SDR family oxidoreductase [Chelatococcus asaccharovorans]CAH1660282.1 NAD(P)-dependent dehydrogenase (Short-subunit alcohol dehydrogenase family) [Chelatococcus asaccharovorans]CAH1683863.1 NAD(P)-dependent dehydrogenase (Short-subunit alcohol dehydrogenase family) [Chelatococcus asaccharovorans]